MADTNNKDPTDEMGGGLEKLLAKIMFYAQLEIVQGTPAATVPKRYRSLVNFTMKAIKGKYSSRRLLMGSYQELMMIINKDFNIEIDAVKKTKLSEIWEALRNAYTEAYKMTDKQFDENNKQRTNTPEIPWEYGEKDHEGVLGDEITETKTDDPTKTDIELVRVINLALVAAKHEILTGSPASDTPEEYKPLVDHMVKALVENYSAKQFNLGVYRALKRVLETKYTENRDQQDTERLRRIEVMYDSLTRMIKVLNTRTDEAVENEVKQQPDKEKPNMASIEKNDAKMKITEKGNKVVEVITLYGKAKIDEDLNLKNSTYEEAFDLIARRATDLEAMVEVNERIVGEPLDCMVAFRKALDQKFGWTDLRGFPGFFGITPPSMITVEIGVNDSIQVPWGVIKIPGIEGELSPCAGHPTDDGSPTLSFHGAVKKKNRQEIADLVKLAHGILREESIYKGKALSVSFNSEADTGHGAPPTRTPKFMDLSHVNPDEVVFSKTTQELVEVSLLEPIQGTQSCIDNGIPLKRTILFAGGYGLGKSMMLSSLGKIAPLNGWTYVHIDSVENLKEAILFCKQYEPAVLVTEDIDQVVSGERTIKMNEILELIDGVTAKGRKLLIVMTTNHPENINPAMLRAGRIDSYIEVTPPDAKAAIKLVRQYGRGLVSEDENLDNIGAILDGHKPSVIAEVVQRSKMAAQRRTRIQGVELSVNDADLVVAFNSMKSHLKLMEGKVEVPSSPLEDRIADIIKKTITGTFKKTLIANFDAVAFKSEQEINDLQYKRPKELISPSDMKNGNGHNPHPGDSISPPTA